MTDELFGWMMKHDALSLLLLFVFAFLIYTGGTMSPARWLTKHLSKNKAKKSEDSLKK